jgi:prepilin-type N-terminal cleavage/methylation domain-containing protein
MAPSRPQSRGPRCGVRRDGFTLLELVAVLVILCVVAAMAAVSLREFGRGRGGGDCAAQIIALTRWARTQAVTEGTLYRLNFDTSSRSYWVTVERYGNFEHPGQEFGRLFTAPDSVVSIECSAPPGPDGQYVQFWPTGRTDPASVRVTDMTGHVTEIVCPSPTELFHVVE